MRRFVSKSFASALLVGLLVLVAGCEQDGAGGRPVEPSPVPSRGPCDAKAFREVTGKELALRAYRFSKECGWSEKAFERMVEDL